jgi:catalase
LEGKGAMVKLVGTHLGLINSAKQTFTADESFFTTASVLYDAVYIPGGKKSAETLLGEADAIHFIDEAFKHCKAIAAEGEGVQLLEASQINTEDPGVITGKNSDKRFIEAIAAHRFWEREAERKVPA